MHMANESIVIFSLSLSLFILVAFSRSVRETTLATPRLDLWPSAFEKRTSIGTSFFRVHGSTRDGFDPCWNHKGVIKKGYKKWDLHVLTQLEPSSCVMSCLVMFLRILAALKKSGAVVDIDLSFQSVPDDCIQEIRRRLPTSMDDWTLPCTVNL